MSPSTNQRGSDDGEEYQTEADRMLVEKPERVLLSIRPMTEANAREWLGAANSQDVSNEVVVHFAKHVERLKE